MVSTFRGSTVYMFNFSLKKIFVLIRKYFYMKISDTKIMWTKIRLITVYACAKGASGSVFSHKLYMVTSMSSMILYAS